MVQTDQDGDSHSEEISLKVIAARVRHWRAVFLANWKILVAVICLFACLGLAYALLKKPVYIAESTFVLQEENASPLGSYASLASLAGISLDNETNGLFSGDNIIELYKSRTLLKTTLLSKGIFPGGPELLIERYIRFNNLRDKWKGKDGLENIRFDGDTSRFTIIQDSIIFDISKEINKKYLTVDKPDKKLGIIEVQVRSKDQLFAKYFNQQLVSNVSKLYIATRSERALNNLHILAQQADSVKNVLNNSISGAAIANDVIPNANPNLSVLHAPSQKKTVDVKAASEVYGQLLQNLELAKVTLRKETPLIQIIDKPDLPLDEDKPSIPLSLLLGGLVGFVIVAFYLVFREFLKSVATL